VEAGGHARVTHLLEARDVDLAPSDLVGDPVDMTVSVDEHRGEGSLARAIGAHAAVDVVADQFERASGRRRHGDADQGDERENPAGDDCHGHRPPRVVCVWKGRGFADRGKFASVARRPHVKSS
jgi:hypothetical protein